MIRAYLAVILFGWVALVDAAEPLRLSEALSRAVEVSKGGRIMAAKTAEAEAGRELAEKMRLPQVRMFGFASYDFEPIDLTLQPGDLSELLDTTAVMAGLDPLTPILGPFPSYELPLVRGEQFRSLAGVGVFQPLTQQWLIGSGIEVAAADRDIATAEYDRTTAELREGVERIFAGLKYAHWQVAAREAAVAAMEARWRDAQNGLAAGEVLAPLVMGAQAALMDARTEVLKARQERESLQWKLADLIGWEGDATTIEIAVGSLPSRPDQSLTAWLARVELNPDIRAAAATVRKASAGTRAAQQGRIPELGAFATFAYQDGLPLLPNQTGTVGLAMTWDVFGFGRRDAEIRRGLARELQANLNEERVAEDLRREVRETYQMWVHAGELVELAEQVEDYRSQLVAQTQAALTAGEVLASQVRQAESDYTAAVADRVGAQTKRHLARLRLQFLAGDL